MTPFDANTVRELIARRGLTRDLLAERAEMSIQDLDAILSDPEKAKIGQVRRLAGGLGVDELALYMPADRLRTGALPDFRKDATPIARLSAKTYSVIDSVKALRDTVSRVAAPQFLDSQIRKLSANLLPERAADEVRQILNLSFEQQCEAPSDAVFYAQFRASVERDNIFVIQYSYPLADGSGFSLSEGPHPAIIVVNTQVAVRARRLFTLAHELFHVIRGDSGISSVFSESALERSCDAFAANLLMPADSIRRFITGHYAHVQSFIDLIPRIARKLKVSQQSLALRLDHLFIEPGLYARWIARFSGKNPDLEKKGGGGGGRDEDKIKLARYGFEFARVFDRAIRDGKISYHSLFELSGLKRDYASSYFRYAAEVGSAPIASDIFGED